MGLCNAIDGATCDADWGQTCDNTLDQLCCNEDCWKGFGVLAVIAAITGIILGALAHTQTITFLDTSLIAPFIISGSAVTAVALLVLFYGACRTKETMELPE